MSPLSSPTSSNSSASASASVHHRYAQRLNNGAANCINIRQYDQAITFLAKALKLSEIQQTDEEQLLLITTAECHSHKCCSIDSSIVFSEYDSINDSGISDGRGNFIYRQPICVTSRTMYQFHNMGSTLSLIITFNLAIAHHLKAIASSSSDKGSDARIVDNALRFYELANEYHQRLQPHNRKSLRLDMIVYNNLSNIYRYHKQGQLQQHEERYQQCLDRLHSTIMLAVDHNKQQHHHHHHHHHVQRSIDTDIEFFEYCNDSLIDIKEGFLQNISLVTSQQRECFPNAA
ncbi:hypothetical protein FRACYDRAFT_252585 [Fragilariopsis cylindrus CCMP1102]|uniref:KIF-binding protein n=1 Tax=Fragilariopsis cylindrus CCMP1102 TaxID=635003 RepID=A0A1E7EN03_9STRA|nr:hypothetical protein FRACYDRAFT_252585 [Fragilariopsis cylindrus CCMP1102]|eukprot:OEU06953.1 hypothetical protein FRACYDRAFT_252585 [Fragilariopsis cylindrus CCMP1102]